MVFALRDCTGEDVKGTFYHQALQKVNKPDTFDIKNAIRTSVRKGRKEFFVKWMNYPDSFNSWVTERDMID